jgi:protein-S-isoprenylcysteine O-methyltransferase Ste14
MSDIQAEIRTASDDLAHQGGGQNWLARLARAGMVAQGVMYLLVGGLAIELALGLGGKTTDHRGALHTVADEWYGLAALLALAAGFAGYALWRFAVAVLGEKVESEEDVGVAKRLVYVVRALIYGGLCYSALALVFTRGGGGSTSEDEATATVFDWPAGRWLVGVAGAAIVGYGLWNGYRALSRNFEKDLKVEQMSAGERRLVCAVGRAGFAARGVVFTLIGIFVVKAALEYDPKEPVGLDGALQRLSEQPYGPALLGTVAAGLIAFGLFSLARARYREV